MVASRGPTEVMEQVTIHLPRQQIRLLDRRAKEERLRRPDIIRRAVDIYFGLRDPEPRAEAAP